MPGLTTPITTTASGTIETALVKNADGSAISNPTYVDCTANGTAANGQKQWICAAEAPAGTYPAEAQNFRVKTSTAASDTALSVTAGVVVTGAATPPPSTVSYTEKFFKGTPGLVSDSTRYFVGTPQETDGAELYAIQLEEEKAFLSAGITPAYLPCYHPMLGGTAGSHSRNFWNPADSDAAYRGVFMGNPVHSGLGVEFNGSNQYMQTFFKVNQLRDDVGHGLFVYAQSYTDANYNLLIGTTWTDADGAHYYDIIEVGGGINGELLGDPLQSNSQPKGLLTMMRQSASVGLLHANGIELKANRTLSLDTSIIQNAPDSALIAYGSRGGVGPFGQIPLSSAGINAKGMPDDMLAAFEAAKKQSQTRLKRNVA